MANSPSHRTHRVAGLIREVLAELISFHIKDPRVVGVTVTEVEITGDLREATVFVALAPSEDPNAQKAALVGLQSAAGFLRREVGSRIRLRTTPTLAFEIDRSGAYGARIDEVLRELGFVENPDEPAEDEPES